MGGLLHVLRAAVSSDPLCFGCCWSLWGAGVNAEAPPATRWAWLCQNCWVVKQSHRGWFFVVGPLTRSAYICLVLIIIDKMRWIVCCAGRGLPLLPAALLSLQPPYVAKMVFSEFVLHLWWGE